MIRLMENPENTTRLIGVAGPLSHVIVEVIAKRPEDTTMAVVEFESVPSNVRRQFLAD